MVPRLLSRVVAEKLKRFPAIALLGPRQSGKTTLARTFSPLYFDLEQEADRMRLDLEWEGIIAGRKLAILDEAQAMPAVFPKIRGAVDAQRKRNGRFLILGSVAPALMKNVSESLAGRLTLCELTPILAAELHAARVENDLWLRGGFPDGGVLKRSQFPGWQSDYLSLLAQRDLPEWGLPARPQTTLRLFKMLAACHGQIWNASAVGASLGLSYHTVDDYLGYLENAYLITRLAPYHANLRKRLVKSPKIYWKDSGLLHALLGVSKLEALLSQPWAGASWEGWLLHQILGVLKARGEAHEAYFLRTSDGYELDLILEFSKGRWAFEFKLTASPSLDDMGRLNRAADLIHADKRVLVSKTKRTEAGKRAVSTNLRRCLELVS